MMIRRRRRGPSRWTAVHRSVLDAPLQDPTRTGIVLALVNVVLYSLMSLASWAGWGGWYSAAKEGPDRVLQEAAALSAVNLIYGLVVVGGMILVHPLRFSARVRYGLIAVVALTASLPRTLAMRAIYTTPGETAFFLAEWGAGFAAGFVAVAAGVFTAELVSRARNEQLRRIRLAGSAARAVDELQSEEMRVRRMVADRLHGTLQYQLVTVTAALDGIAADLDAGGDAGGAADGGAARTSRQAAADLRTWAERLEEIREEEVRTLSHSIYPAGIEFGVVRAVELLLHRLPPRIEARLTVGPTMQDMVGSGGRPIPSADRLVALYTIEEAVTNAMRHGGATRLWITTEIEASGDAPTWVLDMVVDDDGSGLAQPEPPLSGLARHSERVESRGGSLTLGPSPRGGARLHARLPFTALMRDDQSATL